jgi:hypothetical protein
MSYIVYFRHAVVIYRAFRDCWLKSIRLGLTITELATIYSFSASVLSHLGISAEFVCRTGLIMRPFSLSVPNKAISGTLLLSLHG